MKIYEVKRWPLLAEARAQLSRYATGLRGYGLNAIPGGELMPWAVVYRVDGKDYLAWQDTLGVVWFTERPAQGGRGRDPRVDEANRRAVRVTESSAGSPSGGLIPILPILAPMLVR